MRTLTHPLAAPLMVLLAAAAMLLPRLAASDWNPLAFVRHDGVFVAMIANELPSLSAEASDIPAYRTQRILLPALVSLGLPLEGGRTPGLVPGQDLPPRGPATLLVVNLATAAAGALAFALIARRYGQPVLYGVLFGLWIGSVYAFHMGMTELLAYALVAWGLLARERGQLIACAVLLALASLAKEATVLFTVALLVPMLVQRNRRALWLSAVSLGPLVAWQAVVALTFGVTSWQAAADTGVSQGTFPLLSFFKVPRFSLWALQFGWVLLPSLAAIAWGALVLRRDLADPSGWALLLNGAFIASLPEPSTQCLWCSTRIALGVVVALAWAVVRSRRRDAVIASATFLLFPTLLFVATGADFGPLSSGGMELELPGS